MISIFNAMSVLYSTTIISELRLFTIVETQPFSELHKIVCDLFMLL
jgi:hypothetical protein